MADLAQIEGCRSLAGGLRIEIAGKLPELTTLTTLRSIGGDLDIAITNLDSLAPFAKLESIGGRLMLYYVSGLKDLRGLESLTSLGGLVVYESDDLTSLRGLEAIHTIEGDISIASNAQLTSLAGLDGLSVANADLTIRENSRLTSLEALASLRRVNGLLSTGTFSTRSNVDLTSFDGLSALSYVGGLEVYGTSLSNLAGLEGLETIGPQGLSVMYNVRLDSFDGLNSLSVLEGQLDVAHNAALPQCDVDRLAAQLAKTTGRAACESEDELNLRPDEPAVIRF